MIKPIKKPKKKIKLSTLRNKCDKALQEAVRRVYSDCMVCGGTLSCAHHYFPKSTASCLRYDWENLIPICQGCHFRHHNGDPTIHNKVNEVKGRDWCINLEIKKRNIFVKPSKGYYENILKSLNKIT